MTTADVPNSPNEVRPLVNGMQTPAVILHDTSGNRVDLASKLDAKPSVIVFYRGGW